MESEKAEDHELQPQIESETHPLPHAYTPQIGHTAYTLANKTVLSAMQRKDGFARPVREKIARIAARRGIPTIIYGAHTHLVPNRYRLSKTATKVVGMASWRPDMDDFVLNLMRRRTMEALVRLVGLKRGYVVGCNEWEDALAKPQVGAYLWTGGNLEKETEAPAEFATLNVKRGVDETRKVPVHNLRTLLGKEKLAELRVKTPSGMFQNEVLVLKHKNMTVELEMWLWKLQGYLAEYRGISTEPVEEDGDEDFEDDLAESAEDEYVSER